MSEFAKNQLLKYGWTEGKGLGKNENGIAEALKPKLKFDTSGIGHKHLDNYEWWDCVYDKALKNIVVNKNQDEIAINLAKENAFNISTSQSNLELPRKKHSMQYGKFLKSSILHDGNMIKDNTCQEVEETNKVDSKVVKMSDEELFKACKGRRVIRGRRSIGKLARLAEQEKEFLLNANPYLKSNQEESKCKEIKENKKKKRKKCMDIEDCVPRVEDEPLECDLLLPPINPEDQTNYKVSKKTRKKVKRQINDLSHQLTKVCLDTQNKLTEEGEETELANEKHKDKVYKVKSKKKKNKRNRDQETIDSSLNEIMPVDDVPIEPCAKKSKKKHRELTKSFCPLNQNLLEDCTEVSEILSRKDRKRSKCKNIQHSNECKKDKSETFEINQEDEVELVQTKSKKEKSHRATKECKSHCTKTEADKLNDRIRLKKKKKHNKKEIDKLSKSLLVNLNINLTEENASKS